MHSRRSSLLAAVACSVLLVAACSSSDDSATSASTDVTELSAPADTTPTTGAPTSQAEVSIPATDVPTPDSGVPSTAVMSTDVVSTDVVSTDTAVPSVDLEAGAGVDSDFCTDVQTIQNTGPDFQAAPDVLKTQLDDYTALNQKIVDEAPPEAVDFLEAQLADQTAFIGILESNDYDAAAVTQNPEFTDAVSALDDTPEEAAAFATINDYCGISNN